MARTSASALIMVAFLLLAVVVRPGSALTCGQVSSSVGPCLAYLRGKELLTPPCCNGVRGLNNLAKTTADRQQACTCLKSLAARIANLIPDRAAGLPGKCGVSVGYPIATSTDCSKVH